MPSKNVCKESQPFQMVRQKGGTIMGTSQIATPACDFRPEGADGHRGRRVSRALGHHRQQQRLNHLVSRTLGFGTRVGTHLQQAHGKRRQQTQQAHQAVNGLHLPVLNATPTFEALMIVLGQPTIPIPVYSFPRLFECGGGNRGQQDPFQRLLAFGSGACSSQTRTTHTVKGFLLARGSWRGGKSVICPQASCNWVERAWRPCLAGTSKGRLAWLGKARACVSA